jgi:solute carrier family 25 citrate transporter 1
MCTCLLACLPAGIVDCGKQVVNEEGVRALWKGLTPFATHLTLKYALRMGSNSMYQVTLRALLRLVLYIIAHLHAGAGCRWTLTLRVYHTSL